MSRLIVVDDDPGLCALVRDVLEEQGWEVLVQSEEETALPVLYGWRPDVLLLDLWLSGPGSGFEFLQRLLSDPILHPVSVIVCSADRRSLATHAAWFEEHHIPVVEKPFDLAELEDALTQAVRPEGQRAAG